MKIIGLAGGSGAGKNKAAEYFNEFDIQSIDTDIISREVTKKGTACLAELVSFFSCVILKEDGSLDRKKLAEIVFADKIKRDRLNLITHNYILAECEEFIKKQGVKGKTFTMINAPLLFESRYNERCDIIVSVIADFNLRIKRITERDKISEEVAKRRIYSQKCDEFLILKSDYVIFNNRSEVHLKEEVNRVCGKLYCKYQ